MLRMAFATEMVYAGKLRQTSRTKSVCYAYGVPRYRVFVRMDGQRIIYLGQVANESI